MEYPFEHQVNQRKHQISRATQLPQSHSASNAMHLTTDVMQIFQKHRGWKQLHDHEKEIVLLFLNFQEWQKQNAQEPKTGE